VFLACFYKMENVRISSGRLENFDGMEKSVGR
jgi:hypothetical protein